MARGESVRALECPATKKTPLTGEDDIDVIANDLTIELKGRMDNGGSLAMGGVVVSEITEELDWGYCSVAEA